jgi:diguanylate cyclase (GGDEF)-like protein
MATPVSTPAIGNDAAMSLRLKLACSLTRCPLAVVYRIEGVHAVLVGSFGPPAMTSRLAEEAPAWRLARSETMVVPVVGRGPAVPEIAVLPSSFGVAALISIPIMVGDDRAGLLLIADRQPRPDLERFDLGTLAMLTSLIAEKVAAPPTEDSVVRRADSLRPDDSFPPGTAELAAWPLAAGGHDPVTGLPDWRLLAQSMTVALEECAAEKHGLAVALVTLDRFQRIEHWLGRTVGDELMRQVAERLLDTTGEQDLVGRGAADEFAVVLTGLRPGRSAVALADRLLQTIREPFHVHGYELSLTATIGLSRSPEDATDAQTLLRYAGIALHRAKARRQGRLEPFTTQLKEAVEQRGDIERHLRRAIGASELVLHYQPKIALDDRRTTGVEALLRWRHNGKLVSPGMFLPVAEESELIVPIGAWAMHESCRQMRAWMDAGLKLEAVSVNVSALQFARADFVGTVERALKTTRLGAKHLELEVTETSLMDDVDAAAEKLAALRSLGVRVSVDDFGTGYSSLAYLQRLPVDVLKIDRSFVKDLDASGPPRAHAHALAQAITGLGHNLGMSVLAEGVETNEQLEALVALGCDEVQGFLFSKPLPADQLEAFVR